MAKRPPKTLSTESPADAAAGAAFLRAHAVKLFDRQDGNGANWPLMTEALFKAAFDVLDTLPDDVCRSLARRVHAGSYNRVIDGPAVSSGPNAAQAASPLYTPSKAPVPSPTKPGF